MDTTNTLHRMSIQINKWPNTSICSLTNLRIRGIFLSSYFCVCGEISEDLGKGGKEKEEVEEEGDRKRQKQRHEKAYKFFVVTGYSQLTEIRDL